MFKTSVSLHSGHASYHPVNDESSLRVPQFQRQSDPFTRINKTFFNCSKLVVYKYIKRNSLTQLFIK